MIKNIITAGAYTSGNVPSATSMKTNNMYQFVASSGVFQITQPGITEVDVNAIVTATAAGNITLQAYGNGVAIPGALATETFDQGDTKTLHINDVVRTALSNGNYAELSFGLSTACTIVGGDVILKHEA